ncbi:hypothetical protein ABZV93_25435 [Actinopolymorpha sp. NPDC004070]|uniref:hypothetical protein n=1 Tax=Actinopolymorpha sp. NPDC004070 TaxID=3154548 RepID=UPI0033BA7627
MDLWKAMVRIYREHRIDCVVDIYAPPCPPEPGDTSLADFDIRQVILLPSLDVCLERNRLRNRQPILKAEDLRGNYEDFAWCVARFRPAHVIDNSTLTVDETVAAIEAVVTNRQAST